VRGRKGGAVVRGEGGGVEPQGNSDLVSERTFQDFRLHLEFNVEPRSNSGVYLRGRYEVQILDDPTLARDVRGSGGLYGRIAPSADATKTPGEWQLLHRALVGPKRTGRRHGPAGVAGAAGDGIP